MAGRRTKKRAGAAGGAAAQRAASLDDDDGAGLVEQALTPEELRDRSEELISWLVKREQVETKKGAAVEKFNAEIKLAKERIHVLTREIDSKKAYVDPQQTLFDDGSAPPGGSNDAQAAAS
jgi:hypothetical protein